MTSPDRAGGLLLIEVRLRLNPRDVDRIAGIQGYTLLVVAPFLSPATCDRLRSAGLSYIDLAGNAHVEMKKPGLFVVTHGATVNPDRKERPSRSLKGTKAGRLVRMLVDSAKPPGVRELANRASVDPGYASRILALLDREALVIREGNGKIASVDWQRLLRRWAHDAPLSTRGPQVSCIEPRGLAALEAKLRKLEIRYALTGSFAAAAFAPVAPPRLAMIYADDVQQAIENLDLREADAGANVLAIEPADDTVYLGSSLRDGLWYVAASQAAADLLSGLGRGPSEAEELIEWMVEHEEAWRG